MDPTNPVDTTHPAASVLQALEATAQRDPQALALRFALDGDPDRPTLDLTRADLVRQIRRTAALLRQLAGDAPPRVALLLPPVPQTHWLLWGAQAAGGVAIPINALLQPAHLAELLRAAGANLLIAWGPDAALGIWERTAGLRSACPDLREIVAVMPPDAQGRVPAQDPDGRPAFDARLDALPPEADGALAHPDPDAVAVLFHTGGTTGAPKLAQLTARNQLHSARGAAGHLAMAPGDVIVNGFPLFHVAGAFVYGLSALLAGATLLLPTAQGLRHAGYMANWWPMVERHRLTLLAGVPTVMATLMGIEPGQADRSSVRLMLTGGSPLPDELAAAFERRFGIPVRNILGMTECAGVVAIEPAGEPRTPGSCGRPIPGVQVQARRADGTVAAAGETGVLRLRGPNVGPGYTDASRNTGTFEGDWLITGDLGHVDEQGRVFVTGRAKDVIIRSAHNIDPGVIEAALLALPEVQMAAAVGQPDALAGELPVAYVVLHAGAQATEAGLLAAIAPLIPERPALPKRIQVLAALPLTPIGKVYKPALRAQATQWAMDQALSGAGLDAQVRCEVQESAGGVTVRFSGSDGCGLSEPHHAPRLRQLQALMAPWAVTWRC